MRNIVPFFVQKLNQILKFGRQVVYNILFYYHATRKPFVTKTFPYYTIYSIVYKTQLLEIGLHFYLLRSEPILVRIVSETLPVMDMSSLNPVSGRKIAYYSVNRYLSGKCKILHVIRKLTIDKVKDRKVTKIISIYIIVIYQFRSQSSLKLPS